MCKAMWEIQKRLCSRVWFASNKEKFPHIYTCPIFSWMTNKQKTKNSGRRLGSCKYAKLSRKWIIQAHHTKQSENRCSCNERTSGQWSLSMAYDSLISGATSPSLKQDQLPWRMLCISSSKAVCNYMSSVSPSPFPVLLLRSWPTPAAFNPCCHAAEIATTLKTRNFTRISSVYPLAILTSRHDAMATSGPCRYKDDTLWELLVSCGGDRVYFGSHQLVVGWQNHSQWFVICGQQKVRWHVMGGWYPIHRRTRSHTNTPLKRGSCTSFRARHKEKDLRTIT